MKKLLNKINFKKFVSVFTAITFIFTGVFGNSAFASVGSSMPAINTINFDIPIIPTSLGKITSAKYFDSDDIIINIQDLHCHAETQRKIASIIGYIDNTYNLNNVYLEGAFKTVDTSWLSSFNNNKNGTKVLEGLIDSGKLSGTEYYSIINNKKNFVLGIENEDLYKENIKLLGAILSLQPEVNAICSQLEKEINKIKRDYSSKQARKLERLIKSFKQKEIDAKHYYAQLLVLADSCNLSIDKYPNIKIYMSLLDKAQYINNKKVIHEFSKFVSEIKNVLSYQQYSDLVKKSNNFNSLDDITVELIALNKKYFITEKLKLTSFENFLTYLEFNHNINPIKLIQEEENFINELYVKLGRTKYEKEVAFLFDFIPTIKQYFAADISADEYYKFEKNYNMFKTIWPSYFSENTLKNLEQYQKLLSKYHKNNITRDQIFADSLISQKNVNNNIHINDTNLAIKQIKTNLNNKKIKLVVTGGFHTRGLEKIFEQQKISYVIITPKITQPIEQAKQIYIDNVMYYSNLLKNTINLEPLTQEPLNISFPKILNLVFSEVQNNSIFEEYSKQEIKQAIKQFVQEYIISKQSSFYGQVEILNWDIISDDLNGKIEFFVEYKDNANKATVSNIKYQFVDGNIIPYSSIDVERTRSMLERITNNKYAQPSIELEPTNATRKKIAKHIFEPLQKVIGNSISLMPFEQLHMTIGYDSTPMTEQETDTLVQEGDTSADVFSVLDILGQDFVNFRTTMAGTLKLMPDGVIIYEITDKDLIEKMLGFRTMLKGIDGKYKTPSIVHMTIGRISNLNLLDGSEQSKQELAELLEKINEVIYEINKKKALSKIKTTFTLKSGYVSSTGDKDFLFRRILPKKESLVLFSNLISDSKSKLNIIYKVVIAPVIEEFVFRFIPFFVAGLFVSNPVSVIPVIVTGIVGILGFSFAHPLADKISNFVNNKVETGETKNSFIYKLFSGEVNIRNVKDFFIPSTILTAIFVTASFVFPQSMFVAVIISSLAHAINNYVAVRRANGLLLTVMQTPSSENKNLDSNINEIIETLKNIVKSGKIDYEKEIKDFIDALENIGENKTALSQKTAELFDFVIKNHKLSRGFTTNNFNLVLLFEPLLNISIYLRNEQGNLLFDNFVNSILDQAKDKKNSSSRYFDMLMNSAKYFYKNGQIGFVHKIFDSLYQNKDSVTSMTDYKRFAMPVPSPFSFSNVEEWEQEITSIMKVDSAFSVWFMPMLEVLLSSEKIDKYARAYIRALYNSGKETKPAYIDSKKTSYEWTKEYYNACGAYNEYFNLEPSAILLENEVYKEKISLSDLISKLGYLKLQKKDNPYIQSPEFDSVIETLTNALNLSKKEQLQILQEKMSVLYANLFENKNFDSEILDVLAPVMGVLIKEGKTTFLETLCNYFIEQGNKDTKLNLGFPEIAHVYLFDNEKGLKLIRKKFEDTVHTYEPLYEKLYGINWKKFSPKTIEEAKESVPKELQKVIFEYKDLEKFYNAIGLSFDMPEEQSQIFDRYMYVPEYQTLFSFVPKIVLNFKNITKYFRTLKSEQIKKLEVSKEKLLVLDRLLKNGNLALANVSDSADDLRQAIEIVDKMLQDLKFISSDADYIKGLEETLNYIKEQVKAGNIEEVLVQKVAWWSKDKGIYTLISDINEKAISETKNISDKFDAFEKVLENNELALSSLTRMTEDSIGDTIYFIEEMLDAFEIISPKIAQKAKISLLRIIKEIETGKIKIETLSKLNPWTEDTLDKINELHTLINAVHQTSTSKLMTMVETSSSNIGGRKIVLRQDGSDKISFYDCSGESMKDEMKEFLVTLAEITENSEGQCVIKDNKLVYSKQLGFHGVNILVDMEEGIRVTFNDSGRGDGNALRTTLLATLFAQAGFDITYVDTLVTEDSNIGGPCKFTAVYNLKSDFNAPEKYAFLFSQALEILANTRDLDYVLEDDNENENPHYYGTYYIPKLTLEDYRKMKNTFDMPKEFEKGRTGSLISYWNGRIERVKQIRNNFEKSKQEERERLSTLYNYLDMDTDTANPWDVVSEYVKGKLIINDNGILVRNEQYDGIETLLDAIEGNVDDLLRQAQVINLLDYDGFNYETEGYIGGMVALSGLLKLDGKGWLSVKTAVDKERKRAKFAYVEFVDFEGNRTNLDYKDLIKILKEFGYAVKEQKPRSHSEKKDSLTVLKEKILLPKDGIYTRGMAVSGQTDMYIPVRITYDKNNVDENSMWVVSYTSPEDVPYIIKSGAIMTTTGGMLSHANITAREYKKTAILSNGQWVDGKLVIPYYSTESPIEQRRGYEIQKISEHNLVLEEGDVVLANGINGRVLVYKGIPEISEIQKAIDDNNLDYIMKYIQDHYQDENIRQVVEYIFLQVITDKDKQQITQFLLAWDQDSDIGEKVSELVQVYTGEKIKALRIYVDNEKEVEDANIRLTILNFIQQELDVLKYSLTDDDIVGGMQEISQIVRKDRGLVRAQIDKEIKNIIKHTNEILSKSDITEDDKDELIKISEIAKVWKYYGSSEIESLVSEIDKIISLEEGKDYKTEIRGFEDIRAKDVVRYGTKTTELAKLFRLFIKKGIKIAKVPHGIGLSKDVLRIFFEQNGLEETYLQLMEDFQEAIKSKNKDKAIKIGREISKLIESLNDKQLEEYLKSKLDDGKKYAVRSSGVGEDGANHAFAGMAKTALNIDKNNVYAKVKEGWKSFFTDTCIEDMVKAGIVVQPALLVQEMVSGVQKAGVMFTRDNSGNLTIEGVLGLGEGLVSGRITPDHIIVRASDGRIEYRRALNNMIKIEEKAQGGTRVAKISPEERIERILDEDTIRQLQEIADILEKDAGYPADIEFAIDKDGNIFVLQRRAITTLAQKEEENDTEEKSSQEVTVPVIDQPFIDNAIEMISVLSMYKEIKEIIERLSDLPEDVTEKYNVVISQVKELIKFLKKNHKENYNIQLSFEDKYGRYEPETTPYGKLRKFCLEQGLIRSFDSNVYLSKVVVYILTSFLTIVDVNNSGKYLFYSIIDSLFVDDRYSDGRDRNKSVVLAEMSKLISFTYTINPDFVTYIVNKMQERNIISIDEDMPYELRSELMGKYDVLKYYYFALSAKDKVNENIAGILSENVKKLKNIVPLIEDEQIKQDVDTIADHLDELIDKISVNNVVLLEMQLNSLLEDVKNLKDINKEVSFELLDVILSICNQVVKENNDLNAVNLKINDFMYPLLIEEFDNNTDYKYFNNIISKLLSLVQPQSGDKNIGHFKSFNGEIVNILLNFALHVYKPISSHQLEDKNSQEYKDRAKLCFDIFRKLAVNRVTDSEIYTYLFQKGNKGMSGVGLTPETLDILINAAKQNDYILSIPSTTDDKIDGDIELLASMVADSIEYINPLNMFAYSFAKEINAYGYDSWSSSSREEIKNKAKRFSLLIMKKLFAIAGDDSVNLKKRKRAITILLEAISRGLYSGNVKDIPIDFEQVKLLAEKLNMPITVYAGNAYIKHVNGYEEYSFTPLIKLLPKSILDNFASPLLQSGRWSRSEDAYDLLQNKVPIITRVTGQTDATVAEVQQVLFRFEVLQKILQYNKSVLSLLDKIKDSKNYDKNMAELLEELQEMIDELKKINSEHGEAAQEALDNIKLSLQDTTIDKKSQVRRHVVLSSWTKESIQDIKEIHTLINAVHQISIADFKREIGDIRKVGAPIQLITAHQESTIKGYNLSDTINSNIIKFLSKLSTRKIPNYTIDDFICKDDLIVWTTILNAHSVDIFFNFGEADRGINIYYKENVELSYERGKKERVRYFKEILEYLGFRVTIDEEDKKSYSVNATLNKDYGMNEAMDLIDIAIHVIEIFKYSTNIDCDFETRYYESGFDDVYRKWIQKAKRRELWYGVNVNNYGKAYGYGERGYMLDALPEKRRISAESLNEILSYLGCDLLPQAATWDDLTDPVYIDKYFNKPIERAYVEGRIKFNADGILVQDKEYDIVHSMINELNTNFTETSKQARIFNLVNSYEFNTRMLAYIGNFVVVGSVMELKNGDRLFIKAIMDPNTKRMKYAIAEKVTDSKRQKLTSDELIELLAKEGYNIPPQEWVDSRERKRIKNMLSRQVQTIESPKIPSTPTSDGTGVSVVGNITFDKNNVDQNSILVVPYTTPDDMRFIEMAKGIITTGGGILSHAAITTRELKKPSVVLNGATWTNNEIEILYYLASGEPETINNQYQVQKVKATRKVLKEGARVLVNGETGAVLLFDDIDISLLDELQRYIDADDAQAVIDFMNKHSENKNINRLVEYVYFQVVGNSKTTQTLDCLFSDNMPEIVQDKVKELNDSYIQDKVQSISEAIANLKTIDNVNIAYMVLQELNKKLAFIKTVGTRPEIENLREQIRHNEQEIKKKLNLYMQTFINDAIDLLSKDKLNATEIQKIITMLKNIEIYNYFVGDNEISKDLLSKKDTLQVLVPIMRDKVNGYNEQMQDIKLQDEISLFEENAGDEKLFGSKTSQLAKMFKLLKDKIGVIVPGGIGVSVNVMPMLFKSLGKENLLTEFENAIKNRDKQRAMKIAKEICDLIDSEQLRGTELEKEILKQLHKFIKPGQQYSVRSSGVGEDATNNAFAGMGETKLNIGYDDVYENIRECWKSFFAERCIDYMISSGQIVKPAVLIEDMVDSEISGVIFSRDKYGNGTINVLFGQGEGLVSGMFTPDSVLFDMNTGEILEYSVADKQFKLITDANGGLKKVSVGQNAKSRTLNAANVKKLAEIISILENSVGYPIDVEFAIKGNEIYILQMRPITTLDNKEKTTEIAAEGSDAGVVDYMQEIPFVETKYEISVSVGKIQKRQEVFAYIANPLDPTQAIPVYKKSVDSQVTEFVVDSKFAPLVQNGILGRALMVRINTDPVMLAKLNDSIFNYKPGEIGLLPILDEDLIEKALSDSTVDIGIEKVRNILASA